MVAMIDCVFGDRVSLSTVFLTPPVPPIAFFPSLSGYISQHWCLGGCAGGSGDCLQKNDGA
eukprot:COSAG01_NODE_4204_length_5243_cov_1005.231532_5_plen_61_part_00